jgi:energy-coupling factor transport system permease protein
VFSGASFFYRRLPSPLHATRATVGAVWAGALIVATLLLFHPLALLALAAGVLGTGIASGVGAQLRRTLRTAAIVAVPIVAINVLVSREGLTVFARLGDLGPFGQGDLTVEALVYGLVIALKVTLLILITTLASLAIDPEELLNGLRRLSYRTALTASLSVRMIPLLAADSVRLAEAQRTRPGGAPAGARARVRLLGAVIGGSLDRAMDVAATLELRGFAAAGAGPSRTRSVRVRRPWSRHDLAFSVSAAAFLALALLGRLGKADAMQIYPHIHMPLTVATFALAAALLAAIVLPNADRRGIDP